MFERYYEPKYLYGLLKELAPVNAFFRSKFFTEEIPFSSESVTFENMRASRRLLPFANGEMPAPVVGRSGYQARNYTPPLVSGSRVINVKTLESKLPGENEYSGMSPDDRAAMMAASDLEELQAGIQRTEEYLCARLKEDGKIILDGEGVNGVVEYGFTNTETAGTSDNDKWLAGYDVLGKLQSTARKLYQSGTNPDMLILGTKAADALLSNSKIAKLLDVRRMNFGDITPDKISDGVQYLGKLVSVGLYLDLYCYSDFYISEDGEVSPYISEGTAIMQSSRERDFMLYGAVSYVDSSGEFVSVSNSYVPYTVTTYDPPQKKLIVASRPLPMPRDINSWYVLKEVA